MVWCLDLGKSSSTCFFISSTLFLIYWTSSSLPDLREFIISTFLLYLVKILFLSRRRKVAELSCKIFWQALKLKHFANSAIAKSINLFPNILHIMRKKWRKILVQTIFAKNQFWTSSSSWLPGLWYMSFSLVYWAAGGTGRCYCAPEMLNTTTTTPPSNSYDCISLTCDKFIYPILDWNDDPGTAVGMIAGGVLAMPVIQVNTVIWLVDTKPF